MAHVGHPVASELLQMLEFRAGPPPTLIPVQRSQQGPAEHAHQALRDADLQPGSIRGSPAPCTSLLQAHWLCSIRTDC